MQQPADEPVDVVAIMSEIRESIRRKRQQGIYTDEESESLALQRLRSYAQEAQIDPRLVDALMGPSHDWNVAADYSIQTTRSGAAALLLVTAKKLVRPFVRLYTDHLIKRQAQINLYFAHLLHNTVRETARQQIEMQALRHRLSELEARLGAAE
ncbi:MAG TPA: hypothetical protein VFO85_22195 [Vicinamibacteria bacterium]|nr:hypothetical protein [Vicinamibacteria bacterium]